MGNNLCSSETLCCPQVKSSESSVEKLYDDKISFSDCNIQRNQVHNAIFNLLKGEFNEKSIFNDNQLKRTVIRFERNRVHYGVPYNGLYIHPPKFDSDYKTVINHQNHTIVPRYIEGVLLFDGVDKYHATFRCTKLSDVVTKVLQLRDLDDTDCELSGFSLLM